jgi:hypothetical protein
MQGMLVISEEWLGVFCGRTRRTGREPTISAWLIEDGMHQRGFLPREWLAPWGCSPGSLLVYDLFGVTSTAGGSPGLTGDKVRRD